MRVNDWGLKEMFDEMTSLLDNEIKEVRFTNKLKNHPVCLTSKGNVSIEMEKVMNSMPTGEKVNAEKVLEINENHPIVSNSFFILVSMLLAINST